MSVFPSVFLYLSVCCHGLRRERQEKEREDRNENDEDDDNVNRSKTKNYANLFPAEMLAREGKDLREKGQE